MDFININNNNELIDKSQYTFCVSLISQLIEEIEIETKNLNKNNQKKILQSIFSLLKNQIKLFQELFMVQGKQMYNIVQFKEIKNIFDKGKEYIKNDINIILAYSKVNNENISTKNTIHCTNANSTNNSQQFIENKNSNNKNKLYNTKTFNEKINNYLIKNEERKLANDNIMKTITKNNETSNNNSSFNIVKQNKSKKNILNIKKNQIKNNKKIKDKLQNKDIKDKNFLINSENKNYENDNYKSNTKTDFNNNKTCQRISVNQVNKINSNPNPKKASGLRKERNLKETNSSIAPQSMYIDENPVRKVKNIILNARSLSSLNIEVNNKYLYSNKNENLKSSSSVSSFNKYLRSNLNSKNDLENDFERKNYCSPFKTVYQNEPKPTNDKQNLKKGYSKDRKSSEMLIDGMKNIKMKLNSIDIKRKMKKANSIGDLTYIKILMKNK